MITICVIIRFGQGAKPWLLVKASLGHSAVLSTCPPTYRCTLADTRPVLQQGHWSLIPLGKWDSLIVFLRWCSGVTNCKQIDVWIGTQCSRNTILNVTCCIWQIPLWMPIEFSGLPSCLLFLPKCCRHGEQCCGDEPGCLWPALCMVSAQGFESCPHVAGNTSGSFGSS